MLLEHQDRLKELCERCTPFVAFRIGSYDDALDIVQEASLAFWRRDGERLLEEANDLQVYAFFRGILWNKMLHYWRKNRRLRHNALVEDPAIADPSDALDDLEVVQSLLDRLDTKPATESRHGAASIAAQAMIIVENLIDRKIGVCDHKRYVGFRLGVAESLQDGSAVAVLADCQITETIRIVPQKARWVHFTGAVLLTDGTEASAAFHIGKPSGADRAVCPAIIASFYAEARDLGAERRYVLAAEFVERPDAEELENNFRVRLSLIDPSKFESQARHKTKLLGEAVSRLLKRIKRTHGDEENNRQTERQENGCRGNQ
jgi:hypothetical protein